MSDLEKSKKVTLLGIAVACLVLLVACVLAQHALTEQKLPNYMTEALDKLSDGMQIATWDDLKGLEDKCAELKKIDLEIRLKQSIPHPGSKPPLYQVKKRLEWQAKDKAYRDAQDAITRLNNHMKDLITATKGLATKPDEVAAMVKLAGPTRLFWNSVCSPILHLLLVLTLIRYGLGLLIRLMLINGLVHKAHL